MAPLARPPDALAQILKPSAPSAKDFRSHLRTCNNALSMASMSCKQHIFSSGVPAMGGMNLIMSKAYSDRPKGAQATFTDRPTHEINASEAQRSERLHLTVESRVRAPPIGHFSPDCPKMTCRRGSNKGFHGQLQPL